MNLLLLLMMFAGQGTTEYWTGEIRGFAEQSPCYVSSREGYCFTSYDAALRSPATLPERRESRQYHPVAIEKMAANRHTHISTVGWVTLTKYEADGDYHIRICTSPRIKGMDRQRCVVAEAVQGCAMRWEHPKVGEKVRARGISRYDKEAGHLWHEIHPLEGLEILR